jgi:P4 family phage/plasmid primase-like protien
MSATTLVRPKGAANMIINQIDGATETRRDFLEALFPDVDCFVDVRAFKPGGDTTVDVRVPRGDFSRVDELAAKHEGLNLYVGVAERATAGKGGLANCKALRCLFAEIDAKDHGGDLSVARSKLADFALPPSIVVSSGGGLHCYWLLDSPLVLSNGGAEKAKRLLRALCFAVGGDVKAAEPARVLRLPGTKNWKYDPARNVAIESFGEATYSLALIDEAVTDGRGESSKGRAAKLPVKLLDGGRNSLLTSEAGKLRRLGWSEKEIFEALRTINRERCEPRLDDEEVRAIAHSVSRYEPGHRLLQFPFTEAGDAECFAFVHGDRARFDHRKGRWLLREESGIWAPDPIKRLNRLAVETTRERQRLALDITDADQKKRAITWAIKGESRGRLDNALELAKAVAPIADDGSNWDRDAFLLGVQNGVVDLRTGAFRLAAAEDRITMRTRVAFDKKAECPRWERTLADIFGGDAEMVSFVRRAVGYSITGDCREECVFFLWGDGRNGKGTVMNTLGWLLGDYADDMPYSTLEKSKHGGGIPNDVAKLDGKRFVTCSEVNEFELNEQRLKTLTGRDPVTARFLNREFFTFVPACKIWVATNNKPKIVGQDDGVWSRIRLVPFTQSFLGRENKSLKDQLRDELPGILNWAIGGAQAWLAEGLNPPAPVVEATAEYRGESDPITPFIDARLTLSNPGAETPAAVMFNVYENWCVEGRLPPWQRLSDKQFHRAMRRRFHRVEKRGRSSYVGVGILVQHEVSV